MCGLFRSAEFASLFWSAQLFLEVQLKQFQETSSDATQCNTKSLIITSPLHSSNPIVYGSKTTNTANTDAEHGLSSTQDFFFFFLDSNYCSTLNQPLKSGFSHPHQSIV
jgi:hypothetical protein